MTAGITVDQLEDGHALILGTTGSGKTYQLRGLLERLRRADRRVGAVDKLGNHWGLTLGSDGRSAGLEFVIFGGKRAQVPMQPSDGERIAELFVERNIPAIFDVSQWHADDQEEWVTAFAETVFRLNHDQALHLSFDEAQSWVPQGGGGDAFRAVRLLAEQGRGNGIRLLLSCQRLSRLDATVREMMHTVVVMRQGGVIDRKAVRELISADAAQGKLLEAELPQLPVGTGFVWSTGGSALRKVAFPANATFDSSRTPRHGDTPPAPIASASALVDELRAALASPKTDASIPADAADAYKVGTSAGAMLIERDQRIAELEERLRHVQEESALDIGVLYFRDQEIERQRALLCQIKEIFESFEAEYGELTQSASANMHSGDADMHSPARVSGKAAGSQSAGSSPPIAGTPERGDADAPRKASAATDKAKAIRGMAALQVLVSAAPSNGLNEEQWAFLADFARKGGTWSTYRAALRSADLIHEADGRWLPTQAGYLAAADAPIDPPKLGADLARAWAKKQPSTGRLVDALIAHWPRFLDRAELATEADLTASAGTFTTYLGRLRKRGMLEEQGKQIRLNRALMEWQ